MIRCPSLSSFLAIPITRLLAAQWSVHGPRWPSSSVASHGPKSPSRAEFRIASSSVIVAARLIAGVWHH
jgi:hypothetical protein